LAIIGLFLPNKISFDPKKSRPNQMRLFWAKKILPGQNENIFAEKKILSATNKIFSGLKRLCPAKTNVFCQEKIYPRENKIFAGPKEISSGENKLSFARTKFCPTKTKYFLPGGTFSGPQHRLFVQQHDCEGRAGTKPALPREIKPLPA
jgi:hypothetical protein